MKCTNIEDVVRGHVAFTGRVSSKGWSSTYCEVCGDGKRTQGPRGGWLFVDEIAFYNCFNCGVEGNFDPHGGYGDLMTDLMEYLVIEARKL